VVLILLFGGGLLAAFVMGWPYAVGWIAAWVIGLGGLWAMDALERKTPRR
jgi:hypothetical protein